jgi:hypothetical protein
MADPAPGLRPTARCLIACERVTPDPENPKRLSLLRLVTTVRPVGRDSYPVIVPELSVFAQLTECRGAGRLRVEVVADADGTVVIDSPDQPVTSSNQPLAVRGAVFRFHDRVIPNPGLYLVRLLYNDGVLIETPIIFYPPSPAAPEVSKNGR